ncbi:hypothetical protein C2G38_2182052 [Gigaspora rosea]|uniref:PAS domain-containing protein n=1 Tax=Gigaspora rosea TaxID=44941 RepID=A0A397VJM2_9GLOM|nr:hypothetical protein C2G38_2182052 [Gigaspora rosea]
MSLPLINGGDDIENEESKFINMVYNYDWSSTSLGPIDTWDPVLKHVTNLILNSKFPFAILINPPDWILLYNKAYVSILKAKHPDALGKRLQDFLPNILKIMRNINLITTGKSVYINNETPTFTYDGYKEEIYNHGSINPVFKSGGTVCASVCLVQDIIKRVKNSQRLKTLEVKSLESACHIITKVLSNNKDILYTLIYLIKHTLNTSSESLIAHLIATTFDDDEKGRNIPDYLPETHEIIDLTKDSNKNYDAYIRYRIETRCFHSFVLKM